MHFFKTIITIKGRNLHSKRIILRTVGRRTAYTYINIHYGTMKKSLHSVLHLSLALCIFFLENAFSHPLAAPARPSTTTPFIATVTITIFSSGAAHENAYQTRYHIAMYDPPASDFCSTSVFNHTHAYILYIREPYSYYRIFAVHVLHVCCRYLYCYYCFFRWR